MWREWNPAVVEEDFRKLSEAGLTVLRIFPNWADFQPITAVRNAAGGIVDHRFGDAPLPYNAFGEAGVSELMVERMRQVLDMGEKYGMKFIISLVTGHMSGRVFTPPALDGTNPLTDAYSIRWELRMVKCLVDALKDHEGVIGWGLGNETNCMGGASRDQAYVWTATISDAIRSSDPTRPVLSDMHGLSPEGSWSILDQGELTDILTTHPYPLYTEHCGREPVNTIRPILHGVAESKYYSGISGRPVLIEEMGSLGPMVASDEVCADFFRAATFSAWAHDCLSTMWWCNSDFKNLSAPPYDWLPIEAELGLFTSDGSPKPIVEEMRHFREFQKQFPYPQLPPAKTDAMCILTKGQDTWGVAQSAFILGLQAGLNVGFQYVSQPLRESDIYLLPCVGGLNAITGTRWNELLGRIKEGATLYMSMGDSYLPDFAKTTGLSVETRAGTGRRLNFSFEGDEMTLGTAVTYTFANRGAEVLAADREGTPVFTRYSYGKGTVYLLTAPLETELAYNSGSFDRRVTVPYWKLYAAFGGSVMNSRIISGTGPLTGVTEHSNGRNECIAVLINYSPEKVHETIILKNGWKIKNVLYGDAGISSNNNSSNSSNNNNSNNIAISKNDAAVLELGR